MQTLRTPLITVLFIFLAFFVYTKLFGPMQFSTDSVLTVKDAAFQVSGVGKATAVPNTANISLGVTKTASTVSDAQTQANTVANKILEDLKKLGIEEKNIKTTNYSVYPNYDFTNGRQTATGYTVSQNIEVKVTPIDKVNQAIDLATAAGANMVGGITFTLDDKAKRELEDKARKDAVDIAKQKAESLAGAAGIRLGKIIDINESSNAQDVRIQSMPISAEGVPQVEEKTSISPGENTIEITITLSYETH